MKGSSYKPGDILWIPLSDGTHCFGRMYRDSTVGVYLQRQSKLDPSVFAHAPDLVAGVFTTAFKKSGWFVCAHHPFPDEEQSWAPPVYSRDVLDRSRVRIYHRGSLRQATEKEIVGLDRQLMFKPDQLAAEILRRLQGDSSS